MASAVADLLVRVKGDTKGATSKLKSLGGAIGTAGKVAAGAAVGATVAVGALGVKGVMAFADFDKGMREVFTLMPGMSKDAMGAMQDDVLALSQKMGVATSDVVPALYQAISAGVPADNVFEFMETATKASIGGVTDLETSVDGITSVVNAYGAETIDAAKASDLMFTAVKLGKTDMEQLSKSLFQVNPVAAGLGVEFGDVAASLATLTAQGVPTSVAATQVRGALAEMGKDGTKASNVFKDLTGKSFKQFIASGGNMKQAFDIMKGGADDMGVGVSDLFGSIEAGMAVMALTSENGADAFGNAMDEMQGAAGATQTAFDTMDGGISRSWDKIKTTATNALIKIGAKLAPFVEKAVEWLAEKLPGAIDWLIEAFESMAPTIEKVVKWLSENIPQAIRLLVKWWEFIMPIVKTVFDTITSIIQTFVGWFQGDGASGVESGSSRIVEIFQSIVEFIGPIWDSIVEVVSVAMELILTVIDAVWTVVSAIWEEHGERILSFISETFQNIAQVIQGVMEVIQGIIDVVMGIITGDWERVWEGIKGIVEGIWTTITGVVDQAINTIQTVIAFVLDLIAAVWERIWDGISTFVSNIWDGITTAVSDAFNAIKDFITDTIEAVQTVWSDTWEAISTKVSEIWDAITGFVTDKFNAVKDFVSDTLESIKGFFSDKLGAVSSTVSDKFEAVKGFVTDKMSAVKDFVSDTLSNIKNFFSQDLGTIVGTVGDKMNQVWTNVNNWLGNVISTVISKLGEVVGVFRDKFNEARDKVWQMMQRIPGEIRAAIGQVAGAAYDLGAAVVSGILNGLWGLASGLGSKLRGAFSSAFNTVKSWLGMRSPSKKAADLIGKPFAMGITEPIEDVFTAMSGSMKTLPSQSLGGAFTPRDGIGEPIMVVVKIGEETVAEVLAERIRRDYIELDLDNDGWGVRT